MQANAVQNRPTSSIGLDELRNRIASGEAIVLAEVLPAKYYASGHLPKAIHLPLDGLEAGARSALADLDAEIVVYCSGVTCTNSEIAARKLAELGYTRVRVFRGGKDAWSEAGLALEGGAS